MNFSKKKGIGIDPHDVVGLPIGTILPVIISENEIPKGWLLCDGRPIPHQYADLIRIVGPNTPNLTGRTLIGAGSQPQDDNSNITKANFGKDTNFSISSYGGELRTKLQIEHLPKHRHNKSMVSYNQTVGYVSNMDIQLYKEQSVESDFVGKDEPHNNMPPYFTVNYIVYTGLID